MPSNAIRFQGDLIVAELGTNSVVRAIGEDPAQRVTLAEGLGVPAGLAATDDDLWVGDWSAGMVLQIVAGGQMLAEPAPVATGLASPEGLAVAPDGNLLVVETGAGRLSSIDPETGRVSTVAEGLDLGIKATPATPPAHVFSGVAVGPSGTIYITSDINSQLLAIPPTQEEVNKAISRRDYEEAMNLGKLEVYDEIVSPEVVLHTTSGDFMGLEGFKAVASMYLAAFPNLHFNIDDMVAEGDMVGIRWSNTGTHQGELMGIPATGASIVGAGISIHRISNGKIQEAWLFADDLGILQQLGAMPPMPEGPPAMQRAAPEDFVWSAPSDVTGAPGDPEANKAIVMREFDAWNQGDLDALMTVLDESYADDYVHHSPAHPHVTDFEGYKRWAFEEVFPFFPDLYIPVEEVIAEGDKVVVRWGFIGTHIAFGKQVTQTGTAIYRIADGKIVEQWYACDMLTVIQQMGAMAELEANKAVVARSVEDLYNQGNLDVADEVMTVDCIQHEPDGSVTVGIENVKQAMMGLINGFPDLQIVIEDMVAEENKVTARFTNYFGTHQGVFAGMPPTGNEVTFISIATFRLVDGKIAEVWQGPDLMGIMEQLGVMPPTRENYEWGESSQVTGAPGDPETNKASVQDMFDEIFGSKKLAAIDQVVADEFIMHDPTSPMEIRGPEGYKQYNGMFFAGFPDIQMTIDYTVAEVDKVVLRWSASGTHTGEFMSIPPTGRPVTVTGISIFRFADGKIVEIWVSYDALGMMQQLTMSQEEYNKAVALRVVEMWNTGSLDMADELFATDFVNHDPNRPEVIDLESFKQFIVENHIAFPDFHTDFHDMVAGGDKVAVRWTVTGTHKGELSGIPPTCNQLAVTGIIVYRFADGKVVEAWWSYDALGMMQQLGVIPPIPDAPMPFLNRSGGSENFVWGEPSAVTGDPGDPEANRELVIRSVEEIWNIDSADMSQEVMDEIFSSDFINHDPLYSPIVMDAESFKQWIFDHRGDSGPAGIVIDDMIIEGDMIAYSSTVVPINLTGMTICRFADGKMVEQWFSKDVMPALIAMGMLPPMPEPTPEGYDNVFFMSLSPGLNMIALPLKPITPHTARSLAEEIGATMVIRYDTTLGRFVGFTPAASDDGFTIEGGKGYIVNVPDGGTVAFTGAAWANELPVEMAPTDHTSSAWAFVVSGSVLDGDIISDGDGNYTAVVKNLSTGEIYKEPVKPDGYFAAAWADLNRRAVVKVGDKLEVAVVDGSGSIVSGPFVHDVTLDAIRNAVVNVHMKLGDIIPAESALLQNYPNPFNPETWIPFHLSREADVSVRIYDSVGRLIRSLALGHKSEGIYEDRDEAAYWDGRNQAGETVASGVYFYTIQAGDYTATRTMTVTR
jgi:steroid delta-isomerase-like uncharacterized protein